MRLFLDNYKGFVDTIISIKDVNFLVGENSSGKTSVLKLLEVISSPRFWFQPEFNFEDIELGYFSEIVNRNNKKDNSFRIGIDFDVKESSGFIHKFFWLEFVERNSKPIVHKFKFTSAEKSILCIFESETRVVYFQKDFEQDEDFYNWVHDIKTFENLEKSDVALHYNVPFAAVWSMVENKINSDNINRIYVPIPFNRVQRFAPIRATPKRWYESYAISYNSNGEHTPLLLKELLHSSKSKSLIAKLEYFGKESGLFDSIEVSDIIKDYPFELRVKYGRLSMNLTNVGYGVSQVLPLIVELLISKNQTFAIEQPEVHLHPRAQAAFGSFIHDIVTKNKNRLIIETHSDFLINRFRYMVSKSHKRINAQILYFIRNGQGTHVYELPINNKGVLSGDKLSDYMTFFMDEELKMLEI
mgnify:CR=1 FL=1